ncbi:MAG: 50S ribosomal protein L32e [Methanomassiliicoccaceae archaeon]|nr:50S ribosomal protein L32e [Methanomassiliicoccaceae archaeon]
MSVRSLKELPGLREQHIAVLEEMGIKSVADMKKALADESKVKEMIKTLSGVGPKTVDKWKAELEGADAGKADAKEAPAKEAKPVKETKEAKPVKETKDAKDVKDKKNEKEAAVEIVEAAEEDEYVVKAKPELSDETKDALAKRALISGKRPAFKRQEWFRYSKLGEKWRRPKGIHSKMKRKLDRRPPVVVIGYRGPAAARGLHPSGFEEVIVANVNDLESVDPKKQAVRIGGTVGTRKRIIIEDRADELGIRVLNRMV